MNKGATASSAQIETLLSSIGIGEIPSPEELAALHHEIEQVYLPGGQTLFRQGDVGDGLYVVLSGRLRVIFENEAGKEQVLSEIGRGECVGEMAVLTGETRSATVRAVRDTELLRFSKDAFERIAAKNPRIMMLIAKRLVLRLQGMTQARSIGGLTTIALVPVGRDVPLREFAEPFTSALAKFGDTCRLTAGVIQSQFGATSLADGDKDAQITAWLNAQEVNYRYIVYEADPAVSSWTERCMRQSDCVLLVARGESPARISVEEASAIAKSAARKELVLLHSDKQRRPYGTQKWLTLQAVERHHHVALSSGPDYGRLARLLTGNAFGLTLGGGGARGLAHIGVIRALEEAGIPIDMVAGTSMGAVIAAQYALGYDYKAMMEINERGWIKGDPLKDKTIPLVSFLAGRKLDKMLEMMFGEAQIEDVWIGYFCVSANLTQAKPMVHRQGLLRRAVRASMAIPGVAPPLCDGGDLIVDGGVLNNLPGDVMRSLLGGKVIAVDVSPEKDLAVDPVYLQTPSAGTLLWSRLNPLAKAINIPSIFAIMMRTMMLTSVYNSKVVMGGVDLYIRPPVDDFGIFQWQSLDKLVEAGYRQAQTEIEAWKTRENLTETGR